MSKPISQTIDSAIQELEIKIQDYGEQPAVAPDPSLAPYDYQNPMTNDLYSLYYSKKPTIKNAGTISAEISE
jgi:hypothetical protein